MHGGSGAGFFSRVFGRGDKPAPPAVVAPVVPEDGASRRDRGFGQPREMVDDALASKVLHGWLQNRHQVLIPLAFSLARLGSEQIEAVMQAAASALHNGSEENEATRRDAEAWLRGLGAGPDALEAFRDALARPAPLHAVMAAASEHGVEPYVYVTAIALGDARSPAGRLFAAYVAARLAIPADGIRSIDRRYGR